jgi:hypothetical protein
MILIIQNRCEISLQEQHFQQMMQGGLGEGQQALFRSIIVILMIRWTKMSSHGVNRGKMTIFVTTIMALIITRILLKIDSKNTCNHHG